MTDNGNGLDDTLNKAHIDDERGISSTTSEAYKQSLGLPRDWGKGERADKIQRRIMGTDKPVASATKPISSPSAGALANPGPLGAFGVINKALNRAK